MSFTRVNPGGWSVGAKLTSSQMNQLDIDHANALDKTTAGDTLSGPIAMASTATITASTAGNIIASVAGGIAAGVTGGFKIGAGASMTVQGLISGAAEINVNEYAGIIVNVNGSILLNGGVLSSTSGGGIQSGVDGGFALTGDSGDWPTFGVSGASPRVRELYSPCDAVQGSSPTSVDAAVGSITQYYPVTVSDVVFIEGCCKKNKEAMRFICIGFTVSCDKSIVIRLIQFWISGTEQKWVCIIYNILQLCDRRQVGGCKIKNTQAALIREFFIEHGHGQKIFIRISFLSVG